MEREVVWVLTNDKCWTLGQLVSVAPPNFVVQLSSGETVKVQQKEIFPFKDFHKKDLDDLISLPETHEAPILCNLQQRYMEDKIYTYIGPVVISVNPFKELNLSSDSIMKRYLTEDTDTLPPHLFTIAHKAYQSLRNQAQSQSIVISGESGAGKTEATKIILKYLTVASGVSGPGMELSKCILATNPVLEAFGNAKTVRNNNSSRFGKFIAIAFDPGGRLNSASINNYLLETVRVVTQAPTERNYHIFYFLLAGATQEDREKYKLKKDPSQYRYLKHGGIEVDGIDDRVCYVKMRESMTTLGITEREQDEVFLLLSAILHLGNVDFEGTDQTKIKDMDQLRVISYLLKVPEKLLASALTSRFFSGGGRPSGYSIPLDQNQAIENRDAFAKALYSRLFDFLVLRLNRSLLGKNPPIDLRDEKDVRKFIGVLDIYGFEVFEENSVEQFCINYANEKLHQQFNQHMFKAEQALYVSEGVPWEMIKFEDNQDCIDLIEGYSSILNILDEEGKIPKGTDRGFLDKLTKKFQGKHPKFKYRPQVPTVFTIEHYAGPVDYNCNGFLGKNKDTLYKDLIAVFHGSESKFLKDLFADEIMELAATNSDRFRPNVSPNAVTGLKRSETTKKNTVCGRFSFSLQQLTAILNASSRHYVRCIKPNDQAKPLKCESHKILLQLRSNGIMETIRMRKAGYSSHIHFDAFYHRFAFMMTGTGALKEDITNFMMKFQPDRGEWILGNSKIFLREKTVEKLELIRRDYYMKAVTVIQTRIRSWNAVINMGLMRMRVVVIQKIVRMYYARMKLMNYIIERKQEMERQRLEQERIKAEQERIKAEQERLKAEQEKQERLRMEQERLRMEQEKQRLEQERLKAEQEKQERLRMEQERVRMEQEKQRLEQERQKGEQERLRIESEKQRTEDKLQRKQQAESDQDKLRQTAVIVIQKYCRGWKDRREAVGLIVMKLKDLRQARNIQLKEAEEWRSIITKFEKNAMRKSIGLPKNLLEDYKGSLLTSSNSVKSNLNFSISSAVIGGDAGGGSGGANANVSATAGTGVGGGGGGAAGSPSGSGTSLLKTNFLFATSPASRSSDGLDSSTTETSPRASPNHSPHIPRARKNSPPKPTNTAPVSGDLPPLASDGTMDSSKLDTPPTSEESLPKVDLTKKKQEKNKLPTNISSGLNKVQGFLQHTSIRSIPKNHTINASKASSFFPNNNDRPSRLENQPVTSDQLPSYVNSERKKRGRSKSLDFQDVQRLEQSDGTELPNGYQPQNRPGAGGGSAALRGPAGSILGRGPMHTTYTRGAQGPAGSSVRPAAAGRGTTGGGSVASTAGGTNGTNGRMGSPSRMTNSTAPRKIGVGGPTTGGSIWKREAN